MVLGITLDGTALNAVANGKRTKMMKLAAYLFTNAEIGQNLEPVIWNAHGAEKQLLTQNGDNMKTIKEGNLQFKTAWFLTKQFECQNCDGVYQPEVAEEVIVTPNTARAVGAPVEYAQITCPNCGANIQIDSPTKFAPGP